MSFKELLIEKVKVDNIDGVIDVSIPNLSVLLDGNTVQITAGKGNEVQFETSAKEFKEFCLKVAKSL